MMRTKVSEEVFLERVLRQNGMTQRDFELLGLRVAPCDCGNSFCDGWQIDGPFLAVRELGGAGGSSGE